MIIGSELADLVRHSLLHLKSGDVSALAYRFREDAMMSAAGPLETTVVQGRTDVIRLLGHIRRQFAEVEVVDVATDTVLNVMTLKADEQMLSIVVEPDHTLLVRRLILCRSIMSLVEE